MIASKIDHISTLLDKPLTALKGLTVHFEIDYIDKTAIEFKQIFESDPTEGAAIHYVIDANDLVEYCPPDKMAIQITEGKDTYINRALYENKPNEYTIGLLITVPSTQDYVTIENRVIRFCAEFLKEHNFTTDALWRAFDLNKSCSPAQYLDKAKWEAFISQVQGYMTRMDTISNPDDNMAKIYNVLAGVECQSILNQVKLDPIAYALKFQPDDRGIESIVNNKTTTASGEIKTLETQEKNTIFYSVTENAPGTADHSVRATDILVGKTQPDVLTVEPIYPDLIVPPGSNTSFNNGYSDTKMQSNEIKAIPSVEDYEKRQKTFNPKDFKDAKKEVTGKPVNNNDPYPVDEKIKQLESHMPKVKIDEMQFKLEDCNHPGSVIGKEVSKNFAMVQDAMISQAKRTEKRLAAIENNLATITRNLFRLGSRVHINCVYYGGQDVFGKYKTIRCLHDDRIHDGQSVTIDQCMACNRYEPIIGQIYDILDETGQNLAQVLDDNQMSYMTMDEYIELTRLEEMHSERPNVDLTKTSEQPKQFKDIWTEGFKMDWKETTLETQAPNVNEYDIEQLKLDTKPITSDNQYVEPFKDTRKDAETYETLKYNTENYNFEGFADYADGGSAGSSGDLFGGASEARNKILARAKEIVNMAQQGKAHYRQVRPAGVVSDGLPSWDCSSLAWDAYKAAGITLGGNTFAQFPQMLKKAGGIIIPISQIDKALPGDLVYYTDQKPLPDLSDESNIQIDPVNHVGIYAGNGIVYEAAGQTGSGGPSPGERPIKDQIKESKLENAIKRSFRPAFCFARPKALVELDKAEADKFKSESALWDPVIQKIPQDLITLATKYAEGHVGSLVKNIAKWKYAQIIVEECSKKKIDPYLMLAIAATESGGDPTAGGPDPGMFQCGNGTSVSSSMTAEQAAPIIRDNTVKAIDYVFGKKAAIVGKSSWVLAIYAYNAGQGTVNKTLKYKNAESAANTITAGEFAPMIRDYVAYSKIVPHPEVRYSYFSKVLYCYNLLKQKKVLG